MSQVEQKQHPVVAPDSVSPTIKKHVSIEGLDYGDPKVWDLICTGQTVGVFQLEAGWLHQWIRKIRPRNLWDLSSVIAIVRPGAFGFAETYVDVRNGKIEKYDFGNAIVNDILSNTSGILLYQESLILLGQKLAWPHLDEIPKLIKADELRKAVGKKDQEKILKIGKEFVEGCLLNKVDKAVADRLFGIIEDCGRYLFNLSHSMLYAYVAYHTAYFKTYYPKQFYAVYLSYAKERLEKFIEIKNLVNDARAHNVDILPPNINSRNINFKIEGDCVRFGLAHIKGVSENHAGWLRKANFRSLKDFVTLCRDGVELETGRKTINKTVIQALAGAGAFSDLAIPRQNLIAISEFISKLSPKELDNLDLTKITDIKSIFDMLRDMKITPKRKEKLETIISLFKIEESENSNFVDKEEKRLMGVPLSFSMIDGRRHHATSTCVDLLGPHTLWEERSVAGIIEEIKATKTKTGKAIGSEMCILKIRDHTGEIEGLPIFPKLYEQVRHLIVPSTVVELHVKYGQSGWMVENVFETK